MMTEKQRERLATEIIREAYEALDLGDLGAQILPHLDRLMETSTSLIFTFNEAGHMVPIAGSMSEVVPGYAQGYFATDPLQRFLQQTNPICLHSSRMPVWQEYLASAAFNECASPNAIENFLHIRLSDCDMHAPGMIGMMLSRTFRQPDFNQTDKWLIRKIFPALNAFGQRYARLDQRVRAQPFVDALFESSAHPTVILDPSGGFLWASERAEALLKISVGACKRVPESLQAAARKLGTLLTTQPNAALLPTAVKVPRNGKPPLEGSLRLSRTRNGGYFIIVELEEPDVSPHVLEAAERYALTKAETQVLHLLAMGLTDREIGRRLYVSFATVRTHVNRILAKFQVKSRTQAALVARGHRTNGHSQ